MGSLTTAEQGLSDDNSQVPTAHLEALLASLYLAPVSASKAFPSIFPKGFISLKKVTVVATMGKTLDAHLICLFSTSVLKEPASALSPYQRASTTRQKLRGLYQVTYSTLRVNIL